MDHMVSMSEIRAPYKAKHPPDLAHGGTISPPQMLSQSAYSSQGRIQDAPVSYHCPLMQVDSHTKGMAIVRDPYIGHKRCECRN